MWCDVYDVHDVMWCGVMFVTFSQTTNTVPVDTLQSICGNELLYGHVQTQDKIRGQVCTGKYVNSVIMQRLLQWAMKGKVENMEE